ncbi:MAG: ABC transporter permease, partial [Acidobacteriota bacterium]
DTSVSLSLTGSGGEPEQLNGEMVSGDYFTALGVPAVFGRTFRPEEDGAPGANPVVVLSEGFWSRRFGADRGVLGRTILLNGLPFTVIGVAPRGFIGTAGLEPSAFWVPAAMHEQVLRRQVRPFFDQRRATLMGVIARLRDGVAPEQAEAALKRIGSGLAQEYPDANEGRGLTQVPLAQALIGVDQRSDYVKAGALLAAIVAAVLLIACGNVANMLLARASGRRREVAIRLAIGAGRAQLIRQLLIESLLLALLAGGLGLVIAAWSRGLLAALRSPYLPPGLDFSLDTRVLLFALGLSILTGLIFGLVPALQATRPELVGALKGSESAAHRKRPLGLRNLLVVAQIALSLVALAGATLFLISLRSASRIDPGYDRDHLLTISFDLDSRGYDETRGEQFLEQAVERVSALPGVRSAAVAESLVLAGTSLRRIIAPEGEEPDPEHPLVVQPNSVGPGYFDTLDIRILRGRPIADEDRAGGRQVAVINSTMAERMWPSQDPLGRRFYLMPTREMLEVVGVAEDVKYNSLGEPPQMSIYRSILQSYSSAATLHVRTEQAPALAAGAVRQQLSQMDSQLLLQDIRTMSQVIDELLWAPRAGALLLALFGALAVLLSVIGIYGVLSYAVSQRQREIGVRMALGADRGHVTRLFLREGMAMVAAGLTLGLVAAFYGSALIASLLYEVEPRNAAAFGGAAVLLALVAAVATWFPARRAAAVPPLIVIRQD